MQLITSNLNQLLQDYPALKSVSERLCPKVNAADKFSLDELAQVSGIKSGFIEMMFEIYLSNKLPSSKVFKSFPLNNYIQYIKLTHQYYLNKKLPQIELHLQNLMKESSEGNFVCFALGYEFDCYKTMLIQHIIEEDQLLIPYLEKLESCFKQEFLNVTEVDQMLDNSLFEDFENDHSDVEFGLMKTRKLLVKYSRENNTLAHKVLLAQMESFEMDLAIHSKIEEQVLVPKAKGLESILAKMVYSISSSFQ